MTETERRESLEERKKKIEELGMRQIVLSIPVKMFKEFQEGLKTARTDLKIKSNEELLVDFLKLEGYLDGNFKLIEEAKPQKETKKKK